MSDQTTLAFTLPEPAPTSSVDLRHGDCLTVLRDLPDNSVDSVVTDPPYGLSNTKPAQVADVLAAWVTGDTEAVPAKTGGFMGADWDSFVPPPAVWAECLRVLKPGGHMAVFAGARTQDLMGLSIRLAGFEIRDTLGWIYGSGFPKSMDVAKALDKVRMEDREPVRQVCRAIRTAMDSKSIRSRDLTSLFGDCHPRLIDHWAARDTDSQPSLPTWEQWEILRDYLDMGRDLDAEVKRLNDRKGDVGEAWKQRPVTGTAEGWSNRTNYAMTFREDVRRDEPTTDAARQWDGWGTALKPAIEPIILARKPLDGTVAANVLAHGVGGLNIDASRVHATDAQEGRKRHGGGNAVSPSMMGPLNPDVRPASPAGRFPANVLLDEHAAKEMDEQSGWQKDGTSVNRNRGDDEKRSIYEGGWRKRGEDQTYGGEGGASRFFPVFKYQAKAPKRERPVIEREDGSKIQHPTVKPEKLMSWIVTLITPPGGVVLDPFAGSGTTLQAARDKGFNAIGVEQDEDYIQLIGERLGWSAA